MTRAVVVVANVNFTTHRQHIHGLKAVGQVVSLKKCHVPQGHRAIVNIAYVFALLS